LKILKFFKRFFKGEKRAGPIEAIKCIINEFKDNPVTFKKGDYFMTGSVIQPFKVSKGDKLKVDFRTLGKINLDFVLYFFNLLVKNSIIKKTPNIYQYGDVSLK